MPNYCHSNVRFERLNDAAKEKFRMLASRVKTENFSEMMQDGTIDEDEMFTRMWQHEHVGPKWTSIEDIDVDMFSISMNSAWSSPDDGVNWLVSELAQVDPNLITIYTYQEEQPDFAGFYVYLGEELYDGYEDDYDDIKYLLENKVEGLSEMKDDDGDYTEEGWELFHDNVYEVIDEYGYGFIETIIEQIYEEEKDE